MATRYTDLLASAPGGVAPFSKLAQMDVQEQQLEQDFSKLAYMFVADRAAQLMRYLLGFEVVEHEPDGSRAIGVFGFKVGEDYYYIPAFFITNQVRGIDMIFSKKTNMFFPLSEAWIDNIIQRDAIELGSAADSRGLMQDFEHPNFDFARTPTIGSSFGMKTAAAADAAGYDEFADADGRSIFKAAWDSMCTTTLEKMRADPEMRAAFSGFVGALSGRELSKKAGAGVLQRWMSERGGPASVETLFDALCTNVKFANAALTVYPDVETLHVSRFRPSAHGCASKRAERALSIVEDPSADMQRDDRGRFLRHGFYIEDGRDADTLSRVYDYDHVEQFSTPNGYGKFDVLLRDGTTQPAWVLRTSKAWKDGVLDIVLTEPVGTLRLRGIVGGQIYVKGVPKTDASGLYDTAIPLMEMKENSSYLLLDRDGLYVIPVFHVTGTTYTPGSNVRVDGYLDYFKHDTGLCSPNGDFGPCHRGNVLCSDSSGLGDVSGITLTENTGKAMRAGDRILVPSNYRAVLVDAAWDEKQHLKESQPTVSLGDPTDLKFGMKTAGFHDLSVTSDGVEYHVRVDDLRSSRPMDYKRACMSLTGALGLSVGDAERLLDRADADRSVRTGVHFGKAAQFVGVGMPDPVPQTPTVDPYSGVPMYGPYATDTQGMLTGAPMVPHGNPYGENLGGEGETQQAVGAAPMDPRALDLATQAAEVGQRHVFDYSAIGGLAKVYDTGSLIDSYIPQFMQSIDRLGRILFLYYWKNEDFGERYGTSDTVELEDTLRSVFRQFGDLALTLRQKTIDVDGAVH